MIEALPLAGYAPYGLALGGLWVLFGFGRKVRERRANARRQQAETAGWIEPPTLHPRIDPQTCIGCGACAHACPEGNIIGMIGGKAQLLDPGSCIGHGACRTACPVGAIDLVFGSARRGVDIPDVSPDFESNVPGLFIAGELGGMGLIANAVEQGRQAVEAIARRPRTAPASDYDVIIVGGGPAGIAASLAAKQSGLKFLTLEQDRVGGTVARYPRAKIAMTRPARLPLYGRVHLKRVRKERLLELWSKVLRKTNIEIHQGVRVEHIVETAQGLEVATSAGIARSTHVVLATGRRGAPRRLGVSGEDLDKVAYGIDDARRYAGQHVLVIGGGDSALETIATLARAPVASLALVLRGAAPTRACPAQRQRLDTLARANRVEILTHSVVTRIEPDRVTLDANGTQLVLRNDAVIVCIGGTLPMELLHRAGVRVERKFGTA